MKKSPNKLNIGDLVERTNVLYSSFYDCGIVYGKDALSRIDIEEWYEVFWLDTETTDVYPASQLRVVAKSISCGGKKHKGSIGLNMLSWNTGKKD